MALSWRARRAPACIDRGWPLAVKWVHQLITGRPVSNYRHRLPPRSTTGIAPHERTRHRHAPSRGCRAVRQHDPARGLLAHVYRLQPQAGDRAMRQRRHGVVSRAQCAPPIAAGRLARRSRGRPGRTPPRASGRHRGALRGQPDHPPVERPARTRPGRVRPPPGALHHHQPARARRPGCRRACLGRQGLPRRHDRAPRREGPGGRRRRPDPGVRRRGRPRRHAQPVRAGLRSTALLRWAAGTVRRNHLGPGHPGGARHGGRLRLYGYALHRDRRGQCLRGLQAGHRRRERVRRAVHAFFHRHSRQLPESQHRGRRPGPGRPAGCRGGLVQLRHDAGQALEGHLGRRPGRRRWIPPPTTRWRRSCAPPTPTPAWPRSS
ncbi:Uncharacterised protein [Bordetella pertussis]|nr:Uncharacterised protein [Bordetella pertussis]